MECLIPGEQGLCLMQHLIHIRDAFIFPTIHSVNKYLLSNYYVPDDVSNAANPVANKADVVHAFIGEIDNK